MTQKALLRPQLLWSLLFFHSLSVAQAPGPLQIRFPLSNKTLPLPRCQQLSVPSSLHSNAVTSLTILHETTAQVSRCTFLLYFSPTALRTVRCNVWLPFEFCLTPQKLMLLLGRGCVCFLHCCTARAQHNGRHTVGLPQMLAESRNDRMSEPQYLQLPKWAR